MKAAPGAGKGKRDVFSVRIFVTRTVILPLKEKVIILLQFMLFIWLLSSPLETTNRAW